MKLTNDQIEANELDLLKDAILDGSLKLNNDFLSRYCGEGVANQLTRVPEGARAYLLDDYLSDGVFPGTCWHNDTDAIILPHGEIEVQFDGEADEYFETPDDLTIHGDLAYLYTGYGAVFSVDVAGLTVAIDDYLAE